MAYYLPVPPYYSTPTYTYYPTNPSSAFPNMAPLQCMDSCCTPAAPVNTSKCSSIPTTYSSTPTTNGVCTDACCAGGGAPNIIINNPGSGPISGGAVCMDSCCMPTTVYGGGGGVGGMYTYGVPGTYEDTRDTTSSYYYRSGAPGVRYKKGGKGYYTSYGSGCMMM